ncbi:hypothetical protein [Streptomyces sp. NPDC002054]|uniref:hypothetical protein n=1 Tax=Streptomyces sp. NPDC002054 TaxID=3154663 RepID=UPI00332248FF
MEPTRSDAGAEVVDALFVEVRGQGACTGLVEAGGAASALLAALEQGAEQHIAASRPHKTKASYANDWPLWREFHIWLAERTGTSLPLTAVTKGTMVSFAVWLDEVKRAAQLRRPQDHRGHRHRARSGHRRTEGGHARRPAVGQAVPERPGEGCSRPWQGRTAEPGRVEADEHRRPYGPAEAERPPATHREVPELARLRDRALNTLRFAIAGRNEEVSAFDDPGIRLVAEGLEVHVPSVKGRPARDVVVAYGSDPDTCPVRCWLAWPKAKHAAGAGPGGPAFLAVDQWGNVGSARLSQDGCGRVTTRSAEQARLEGRRTGHSGRRGLVTTGRKRGKRVEKLRTQGGWSPKSHVF